MKINPDIVFRKEYDGTAVLFNPDNGETFFLNAVSTLLYEIMQKGCASEQELFEGMKKRVTKIPANASDDVHAFVQQLVAKNILSLDD